MKTKVLAIPAYNHGLELEEASITKLTSLDAKVDHRIETMTGFNNHLSKQKQPVGQVSCLPSHWPSV